MESGKVNGKKITLGEPKRIKYGNVLPILYDGAPKALKIHLKYAEFEVFENSWQGKSAKIIGIPEHVLENLREIRYHIISLTRFPPKDVNFLKGNHIFAKLEKTRFWKKRAGNKKSPIEACVNFPMRGQVVLIFKQLFLGARKSITCVLDEALIEDFILGPSFFEEEIVEWEPFDFRRSPEETLRDLQPPQNV